MDYRKFIVSDQKEDTISIQRVKKKGQWSGVQNTAKPTQQHQGQSSLLISLSIALLAND